MKKVAGICVVAKKMQGELKRRFQYATNPSATNFDPIYITGTLLHPGHCELLQTDQEEAGKAHILEIIQFQSQRQNQQSNQHNKESSEGSDSSEVTGPEGPPPHAHFKHLAALLAEKRKQQQEETTSVSDEEIELQKYMSAKLTLKDGEDPLDFWSTNTVYANLSAAA